jgi:endonuclease/exonuclease/phosphatase family metal-dependent hydrolase
MQIKILSWNIWIDSYFDQIKEFLKNSQADVIGLQEVREDNPSRETIKYSNSLGYKHVFTPTEKDWGEEVWSDGPTVFTTYEIASSKKHVLSEDGMHVAVQADIKINDKILHVFSTHLTHTHQKDSVTQLQQVEELLKHIPSEKSVLMGDFNATPESSTVKKVKTKLVNTGLGNQPTWSVYPQGCGVCKPQKIGIRLDYIFTTIDMKTHSYKTEESKGSDHLPISVIVEL